MDAATLEKLKAYLAENMKRLAAEEAAE